MNVTEATAKEMICPIISAGREDNLCRGSGCMMWQWDVPLMLNPPEDSYLSEPGPTGHCGLTEGIHA